MPVYKSVLTIEGATLGGDNPLPKFRNRQHHRNVPDNGSLAADQKFGLGYETGERFLPYRMQDRYTRERTTIELASIIIENEILLATFLPDYGGRLYSLLDKRTGQEVFYKNPVFQPANLAILNAWFSGGVEWNISQLGHTFTTCSPLHAARLEDGQGNSFLRFYEYERQKNVFWQLDVHLPPGSEQLQVHVRIVNDQTSAVPMYWWTNIAVDETPRTRIFSSTSEVIYIDHHVGGFGAGDLPCLPTVPGADVTYPGNFPFANEYFFQTAEGNRAPWEAVVYEDGKMVYERSTARLRYRKMFCWGNHAGGRRWCDFLAKPGEGDYLEIQGGFAPTQLHGLDQPAHSEWDFTQLFGVGQVDADAANNPDWIEANAYVAAQVDQQLSEEAMGTIHTRLQQLATQEPIEHLHIGPGWGALERERRERTEGRTMPTGLPFPAASLGVAQEPWLALLREGRLPALGVDSIPASWMVQPQWQQLLQASLEHEGNATWDGYLHLGIMRYELGEEQEAVAAWEQSLHLQPSAWAYRNLAEAKRHAGDTQAALGLLEQAYEIAGGFPDRSFAEEYLQLLIASGQHAKAWRVYETLPAEFSLSDRLRIIVGEAALELGNDAFVEHLLDTEFAVIREGELSIVNLWYDYNARKLARDEQRSWTEEVRAELRAEAERLYPPPAHLDFRMM